MSRPDIDELRRAVATGDGEVFYWWMEQVEALCNYIEKLEEREALSTQGDCAMKEKDSAAAMGRLITAVTCALDDHAVCREGTRLELEAALADAMGCGTLSHVKERRVLTAEQMERLGRGERVGLSGDEP